ncbi:MAG: UDP-N-acetylmuramoyl-tripeptide--D-alanyl-D-alanine ligase [Methylococcales bacterium]|nr:UDP-N-acetylmuramoyl-tripeptide--D-alanyl-D-alanine ligase [Methylococcales bacterium]
MTSFSNQLVRAREIAELHCNQSKQPHFMITLFFSVSDGQRRAKVTNTSAKSFDEAWGKGLFQLKQLMLKYQLKGRWLKVEWVTKRTLLTWGKLESRLKNTKRNYFRFGIALDQNFAFCFLEQELNANAMLYQGSKVPTAALNIKNFGVYAKLRYQGMGQIDFSENTSIYTFSTQGLFIEDNKSYPLAGTGWNCGRRDIQQLNEEDVLSLIDKSSCFLADQVQESGQFIYGYFPCFDRQINYYNALRHASSTYAMIEAWALNRSKKLLVSIHKSLNYLVKYLIKGVRLESGEKLAFLVDKENEIKLGGNAVCLLALVKYSEVTKTRFYDDLLASLALGIAKMQNPETGQFVHILNYPDLSVKEVFRVIYYDGEAAFGLMRLYRLTKDERWLALVERAFCYFIVKQHWKAHDHWLSYCVNELTLYRPEVQYFRFGLQNFSGHLDFVLQRQTTFPTLLELMMAAEQMLQRINSLPDLQYLLLEIDLTKFYQALHFRAHHLLNGHFWPEVAMYFRLPDRIVNSFFIRHHAFRVRIDDVEHYLSGFIAYHKHLKSQQGDVKTTDQAIKPKQRRRKESHWSAESVAEVTQGVWIVKPKHDWAMTGVCIALRTFKAGQVIVVSNGIETWGIGPHFTDLIKDAAAIICSDATGLTSFGLPVLQVPNNADAVLKMGGYARKQFNAPVFGITGSAGKTTTCAMLAHVLEALGTVGSTACGSNFWHGIAWNMASMPWDAHNIVLEMAIARMPINSQLVYPHVAIITNIAPAHLEYHLTTDNIARKKSAMFAGMVAGGHAVIYADMVEFSIFQKAALEKGLSIISFGEKRGVDVRLLHYDAQSQQIFVRVFDMEYCYQLGIPGKHMALNSLACIAAVVASGQSLEKILPQFKSFEPVEGRGVIQEMMLGHRKISLLDETYNANPMSMKAMLSLCQDRGVEQGRRVIILGDMLELGQDSEQYHQALLKPLLAAKPDRIILCGKMMKSLWKILPSRKDNNWFENADQLKKQLMSLLYDKDFIAMKSSNGVRFDLLVAFLKDQSRSD